LLLSPVVFLIKEMSFFMSSTQLKNVKPEFY
jgi:hypothetical protein